MHCGWIIAHRLHFAPVLLDCCNSMSRWCGMLQ